MVNNKRQQMIRLIDEWIQTGKNTDFFQFVRLLDITAKLSGELQLKPSPSRKFPASDVCYIDYQPQQVTLWLTFMGLYGVDSPLPHYWTDITLQENECGMRLCTLLDIFQQRIYMLLYLVWCKYRSEVQLEKEKPHYLHILQAISGNSLSQHTGREIAYAGLLGCRNKNALNLQSLLSDYLHTQVIVHQFVLQWQPINTCALLGKNLLLADNTVLGKHIADMTNKIMIVIGPVSYLTAKQLLPGQDQAKLLHDLITRYLESTLQYEVILQVKYVRSAPLCFGQDKIHLGYFSWLGRKMNTMYQIRLSQFAYHE